MASTTNVGIMTFSIIGAIWVLSSSIDAARLALVRAYSTVTRRPSLRRRAEGLLLVIMSASSIILVMTALVFFYFLSGGFILGAEINAALYHQRLGKLEKNNPSD